LGTLSHRTKAAEKKILLLCKCNEYQVTWVPCHTAQRQRKKKILLLCEYNKYHYGTLSHRTKAAHSNTYYYHVNVIHLCLVGEFQLAFVCFLLLHSMLLYIYMVSLSLVCVCVHIHIGLIFIYPIILYIYIYIHTYGRRVPAGLCMLPPPPLYVVI
jgi:hypothetical protein